MHQPSDPLQYIHEEVSKIKQEMEECNVSSLNYMTVNTYSVTSIRLHCIQRLFHTLYIVYKMKKMYMLSSCACMQVDVGSTTFLTTQFPSTESRLQD